MDFQHHLCTEAHANLLAKIVPTLGRLFVHGGNGIARLNARNFCRRIVRHKAHDEVLVVVSAYHVRRSLQVFVGLAVFSTALFIGDYFRIEDTGILI